MSSYIKNFKVKTYNQRQRKQSSSYYIGKFSFFPVRGLRALIPTSVLLRLDSGKER